MIRNRNKYVGLPEDFIFFDNSNNKLVDKMQIEINLSKFERGTHKEKVAVHRKTGTTYEYRRVGRKSPREGTGKIAALSDDIKNEILALRRISYSGADIKRCIEEMIDHSDHPDPETSKNIKIYSEKYDKLFYERKAETDQNKIKELDKKIKENKEKSNKILFSGKFKISTYVNDKPTGRNFLKEGLIDEHGKLTVTGQALTDWAKKQGVESHKKRKTVTEAVTEATKISEKQFLEANQKLARLQVKNKELTMRLDREQKSKQKSDEMRVILREENYELQEKLKENDIKLKELEEKHKEISEKVKERVKE